MNVTRGNLNVYYFERREEMAREILSIPEEKLSEVIAVIRQGLKHLTDVSDETRKQLTEWCNKEEDYLKRMAL